MRTVNHYFQTIIASGSVKHELFAFETESEAIQFAEDNRWSWLDENEFWWAIEIEERDDELSFFEEEDFLPDDEPDDIWADDDPTLDPYYEPDYEPGSMW